MIKNKRSKAEVMIKQNSVLIMKSLLLDIFFEKDSRIIEIEIDFSFFSIF